VATGPDVPFSGVGHPERGIVEAGRVAPRGQKVQLGIIRQGQNRFVRSRLGLNHADKLAVQPAVRLRHLQAPSLKSSFCGSPDG
jgi:hypothetical protein